MATPHHQQRDIAWDTTMRELKKMLDAIPFTAMQRRNIDEHLEELHTSFVEANKAAAEWEGE